jgi:hypothetical protein
MATDFAAASVLSIRKVKADDVEQPPVYFVETALVLRDAGVEQGDAADGALARMARRS